MRSAIKVFIIRKNICVVVSEVRFKWLILWLSDERHEYLKIERYFQGSVGQMRQDYFLHLESLELVTQSQGLFNSDLRGGETS